jgi:hypothetical protein
MEPAHPKDGSRRSPGEHQRAKTMTVRFTDGELAAVRAAAERSGMAASAWVGEPTQPPLRKPVSLGVAFAVSKGRWVASPRETSIAWMTGPLWCP